MEKDRHEKENIDKAAQPTRLPFMVDLVEGNIDVSGHYDEKETCLILDGKVTVTSKGIVRHGKHRTHNRTHDTSRLSRVRQYFG